MHVHVHVHVCAYDLHYMDSAGLITGRRIEVGGHAGARAPPRPQEQVHAGHYVSEMARISETDSFEMQRLQYARKGVFYRRVHNLDYLERGPLFKGWGPLLKNRVCCQYVCSAVHCA